MPWQSGCQPSAIQFDSFWFVFSAFVAVSGRATDSLPTPFKNFLLARIWAGRLMFEQLPSELRRAGLAGHNEVGGFPTGNNLQHS
jgi:hypothetical protein